MTRLFLLLVALCLAVTAASAEPECVLTIEAVPPRGEAVVWSPLFQASWDKLNAIHGGKPEKVEPPNARIAALDTFQWNEKEVMPDGAYGVFAGVASPEFFETVKAEIKSLFGEATQLRELPPSRGGWAVYGILIRNLEFKKQFFRSKKWPLPFQDGAGETHQVHFFGTTGDRSSDFGSYVKVLDYKDAGAAFILSIMTDQEDEKIILYRPGQVQSFAKAIAEVDAARKNPLSGKYGSLTDGSLHTKDTVKIPYLSFDAHTNFTDQLQGVRYYPKEPQPWQIGMAYKTVRFELSEKGAKMRVTTGLGDDPFGAAPQKPKFVPRTFICDEPFYVFAWRDKAALPYFSAWIDGAEVLRPFSKTGAPHNGQ